MKSLVSKIFMVILIVSPGGYLIWSSLQSGGEQTEIHSEEHEDLRSKNHQTQSDEIVENSISRETLEAVGKEKEASSISSPSPKEEVFSSVSEEKSAIVQKIQVSVEAEKKRESSKPTESEQKETKEVFKGTVRVSDSKGNPMVGVKVECRNMGGNEVLFRSVTDDNGLADMGRDKKRDVMVIVRPEGQTAFGKGHVKAHDYGDGSVLELVMPEEVFNTKGKVVDRDGNPIPGAEIVGDVRIPSGSCTHHAEGLLSSRSDEKGEFELGPFAYELKVSAELDGWVQREKINFDPGSESELQIVMDSALTRKISVLGINGEVLDEVDIFARASQHEVNYFHNGEKVKYLRKVSGGTAEISMPREGFHHFQAKSDGYLNKELINLEADEENLMITLEVSHFITGMVTDLSGNPIKGTEVSFSYINDRGNTSRVQAKTDAEGHYRIKGIPPTTGSLRATHQNYLPISVEGELDLRELSEIEKNIQMKEGLTAELVLIDEETQEPIPEVSVSVTRMKEQPTYFNGKTDSKGLLKVTGCEAVGDQLQLRAKGYLDQEIVVEEGQGQRVVLAREVEFQIALVLPEGEKPPHNITLNKVGDHRTWKHWKASKTKGGFYKVKAIRPQKLKFTVNAHGYKKSDVQEVEILPANNPLLRIELVKAERVVLSIVDEEGKVYNGQVSYKLKTGQQYGGTHSSSHQSSKNGKYTITISDLERYESLRIQPKGYLPSPWYGIRSGPTFKSKTEGTYLHEIPLPPKGDVLKGRVVNDRGEGVGNVNLEAIQGENQDTRSQGRSQSDGRFEISGLKRSTFKLEVFHKDYEMMRVSMEPSAFDEEHRLELREGNLLEAGMRDPSGEPVSGIDINIRKIRTNYVDYYHDRHLRSKKTNSDGKVAWRHLGPGRYALNLAHQDKGLVTPIEVEVGPDHPEEVHWLEMRKGVSLKGKVIDESGKPISNLHLNLSQMSMSNSIHRSAQTATDGSFVFNNLPEGQFRVGFYGSPWRVSGGQNFVIVEPGPEPVEIKLSAAPMVKGKVLDGKGDPLEGYQIMVYHPTFPQMRSNIYNLVDLGGGRFEGAPPADYGMKVQVQATHPDWSPSEKIEVDLSSGTSQEITLKMKTGTGMVLLVLGANGDPISGAGVTFSSSTGKNIFGYVDHQGVHKSSDHEGKVEFKNLPDGPFEIRVNSASHAPFVRKEDQLPTEGTLTLQLTKGADLRGRVLTATGEIAPDSIVSLWSGTGVQKIKVKEATSDSGGRYELLSLSEGDYEVQVNPPESRVSRYFYAMYDATLVLKKLSLRNEEVRELDLSLASDEGKGSIKGRIESEEKSGQMMTVQLFQSKTANSFQPYKMINPNGDEFEFKAIPPGDYRVVVMANSLKIEGAVTVRAGEESELVLKPEKGRLKAVLVSEEGPITGQIQVALVPAGTFNGSNHFADQMNSGYNSSPILGELDIQGIKSGVYDLMVMDVMLGKYAPHMIKNISINDGVNDIGEVKVPLSERLSFSVEDSSGKPVSGAGVGFTLSSGEYLPNISFSAISGPDGKMSISLPPDALGLVVGAPGKAMKKIGVPSSGEVVVLSDGGKVKVQVKGDNVDGWFVSLLNGEGESLPFVFNQAAMTSNFQFGSTSDAQGDAVLENLSPGEYMLEMRRVGFETVRSETFQIVEGQKSMVEVQAGPKL